MTPAAPASAEPMKNVAAMTRSVSMPIIDAASRSNEVARIALPSCVRETSKMSRNMRRKKRKKRKKRGGKGGAERERRGGGERAAGEGAPAVADQVEAVVGAEV